MYEQQIKKLRDQFSEAERSWKSKHETQLSQINTLNKDRIRSEREAERAHEDLKKAADQNEKLSVQIEKQINEIERMNEYIQHLETSKSEPADPIETPTTTPTDPNLNLKVEQLTKELQDQDHKYIQLMEKLKQTQDEYRAYKSSHPEELSNLMPKDEHKSIVNSHQQMNQELMTEIKKLHLTIEKQKQEDEKLRKVIASNSNTPTHKQLLVIKEFTDIAKLMRDYDDDHKLENKEIQLIDLVSRVLQDYDNLTTRYQMVEQELIKTKMLYAESEEIKERVIVELDTIMGNNNVSKFDKTILYSDEDKLVDKKPSRNSSSGGIFAKASNLFSSASTFYSGRFGNNS